MKTINRFGAVLILASVLVSPNMAYAKSAPVSGNTNSVFATADLLERKANKKKVWVLPNKCNNDQAKMLFESGFKKPGMLRGAWAITWRESKHQSLDESSRWFSGAIGTWQIQTSAWSGKSWWTRSAMIDKKTQSKIVRKHFLKDGMRNWGYGYSFKNDTWYEDAGMYYHLWGSSLTYSWVINPFNKGWSLFPKKCTPSKK